MVTLQPFEQLALPQSKDAHVSLRIQTTRARPELPTCKRASEGRLNMNHFVQLNATDMELNFFVVDNGVEQPPNTILHLEQ